MDLIVVGAGEVTRQLLRRLGEAWDVVVVDTSGERLDALRGARAFEAVQGDGSSPVVLRRAGLEGAEALVAATGDDDVNLEACRIGREARVRRLMAVVANPSRIGEYRDLEVTVLAPASSPPARSRTTFRHDGSPPRPSPTAGSRRWSSPWPRTRWSVGCPSLSSTGGTSWWRRSCVGAS